jgi:hypothetical protein
LIRLRRFESGNTEGFRIYEISNEHNHELFEEAELEALPQNRFIPENVEAKMLELNSHGVLTCSQIMLLIEREHFPEVKVSWTVRDVQNLLQKQCDRKHEAHDFVTLLNSKKSAGWEVSLEHDPESLRLQKIFWVSGKGKDQYQRFHDVLEMDATYKTNRYQSESKITD